jgi:hypothetical protein
MAQLKILSQDFFILYFYKSLVGILGIIQRKIFDTYTSNSRLVKVQRKNIRHLPSFSNI